MLIEIQKMLTDKVINEFAKRYDVPDGMLVSCGSFESFVYCFENQAGEFILKITHSSIKDKQQIASEIEFVEYMYSNGVPVSNIVKSKLGRMIEEIKADDGYFYARCYVKAEGNRPTYEQWNTELFTKWGQTMGKMHKLSKNFNPSPNLYRLHWNENERLRIIPQSQPEIVQSANKIISHLKSLPHSVNDYGIIHNDFHQGNFFISGNNLTVFDFDDMEYSWYINDIAMVLYYAVYQNPYKILDTNYPEQFFNSFMDGYNKENHIDKSWYKQIPYFLKLRHIILYIAYRQSFDLDNLQKNQSELLSRLYNDIIANKELLDLSFLK